MFWEELKSFVKQYPLQMVAVSLAAVTILVNIKSTKRVVKALEMKRRK